jgi:hypothetical protein
MDIDGTLYAPTDTIKFNGKSSFQRNAHLTNLPIPSGFAGLGAATRVILVR